MKALWYKYTLSLPRLDIPLLKFEVVQYCIIITLSESVSEAKLSTEAHADGKEDCSSGV